MLSLFVVCLLTCSSANAFVNFTTVSDLSDNFSFIFGDQYKLSFKLLGNLIGLIDGEGKLLNLMRSTFRLPQNVKRTSHVEFPYKIEEPIEEKTSNDLQMGFMERVLNTIGFDSGKMGVVAVNLAIFVARLIGNYLSSKGASARRSEETPNYESSTVEWITQQPRVARMLEAMQDEELPDKIIREIDDRTKDQSNECIKLLMCKCSPIISGMQKSFVFFLTSELPKQNKGDSLENDWSTASPIKRMFFFLPTMEDIVANGDSCDAKFPTCRY